MNAREFFDAVEKMRRLQRSNAERHGRDPMIRSECERSEKVVDDEIRRVKNIEYARTNPPLFRNY